MVLHEKATRPPRASSRGTRPPSSDQAPTGSSRTCASTPPTPDPAATRPRPSRRSAPTWRTRALPRLRHRPATRLADRHRHHRRRLPPPDQRQARHHRSPLVTSRRRSRPETPRPDQQRRLRTLLRLASPTRAPAQPSGPLPGETQPRSITRPVTPARATPMSLRRGSQHGQRPHLSQRGQHQRQARQQTPHPRDP